MSFENLLECHRLAIERFVHFKISNYDDAEDVLQEVCMTAFESYSKLSDESCFKAWLLKIARNKCNDYYRVSRKEPDILSMDDSFVSSINAYAHFEISDLIGRLSDKDSEVLSYYYIFGYSVSEIAERLNIPAGTVKSRLFTARSNFKKIYGHAPEKKSDGGTKMNLPDKLYDYKIIKSDKAAFPVKCEELMGWMIVPKTGEKVKWASYDMPDRSRGELMELEVTGKAEVHGIEGVEILAREHNPMTCNIIDDDSYAERKLIAQLTDTHCRILAEIHKQNGVTKYYTFLDDSDDFLNNWGYGKDNCGKEINISPQSTIIKNGSEITSSNESCMDIVGRYTVIINNQEFDTVCIMDIETYEKGVLTEQYVDKNGKTILWRRFNADDWQYEKRKILWSDKLPNNEMLLVNKKVYVHWYDCISDYITK